jgi:hypothetical protein
MKLLTFLLVLTLVLSCSQPSDATLTPSSASDEASEVVLGSEYAPFVGTFSGRGTFPGCYGWRYDAGCFVRVTFDKNTASVSCITRNVIVYFGYTFVLDNETITTYEGEYPIIWWFECKRYPYVWDGGSLIITDPVNNRVLTLKKE